MATVDAERWERVKQILQDALACQVDQRAALLDQACGDDAKLRAEVERLLAHHQQAIDEDFLASRRQSANPVQIDATTDVPTTKQSDSNVLAAERDTVPPAQSGDTSISSKDVVDQVFGRYRLVKLLGQGGMGAVYLTHDTTLDRQVAL